MITLFFFIDTATTEIYPLSLHDPLPIWLRRRGSGRRHAPAPPSLVAPPGRGGARRGRRRPSRGLRRRPARSEEHTSELQSRQYLVCRLLLEKKKNIYKDTRITDIRSYSR